MSQNRVKILAPAVAERIAAGEVVDRPCSIVKELVENSLDAQASFIEVELVDGGRELIRVTDDGIGMTAEDANLAFERHATSKLQEWEDLDKLNSFGFRGEALPSIAAVSRIELETTPIGQEAGTKIRQEGPAERRRETAPGVPGTRISVRDLFWNTPARRKFLKSPASEGVQVSEVMTRFAVLNPGVGFRLVVNEKEKLFYRKEAPISRRLASYWKLKEEDLMDLDFEYGDLRVEGVIAKPVHHRRNRSSQIIAVNGRIIRSQSLSQAFSEGYEPLVPRGRHPYCFVNILLDPSMVDVNIHPTKAEVRFAEARKPFSAIYRAVRQRLDAEKVETLKPAQWSSTLDLEPKVKADPFLSSIPKVLVEDKGYKDKPLPPARSVPPAADRVMEMYRPPEPTPSEVARAVPEQLPLADMKTKPEVRYLDRLYGSYIVARVGSQLWVIDQHAAHERISYESLHRFQIVGPESQCLVIPFPLDLSEQDAEHLELNLERFQELGFDFNKDHEGYSLVAVPPGLPGGKVEYFFQEILNEISSELPSHKNAPIDQYREKLRAMMACKASIRAREAITPQEAVRLIEDLLVCEQSPYCPHGRPTRIRLDETTLERLFHRS